MVPVTMIVGGMALGIWSRSRARAHRWLVAAFLVVLVIQSVVVFGPGHGSSTAAYWLVQAASLAAGLIVLNATAALRRRTAARRADPAA
jgi:peptidoglycan/LPS O-acetylase OafA/YrhL